MKEINIQDLRGYIDAYSFIELSSGKTIINILKTERIMRMVYDKLFENYNISEPKFFVIMLLSNSPSGISFSELGKTMMVSRANMTTLIGRMEKENLVKREKNAEDKRSTKAHLTEEGHNLFNEIKDLHKEFSERMMKSLSEDEKNILNDLLKKIQQDIIEDF